MFQVKEIMLGPDCFLKKVCHLTVIFFRKPIPALMSTSCLAGLLDIFILLHISQNSVCFGDFLPMRTLCDAYHKVFESH